MHNVNILVLQDITVIFFFSTASLLLCSRLKIPGIIGYLITGLLVGPNGFSLITGVSSVDTLAEIGVVLLLFTIGLEFSLQQLISLKRLAIGAGSLQVLMTIVFFTLFYIFMGQSFNGAVFMGMLIALSSTAIVLKLLVERSELESPAGRSSTAILIFQDIIIVPMMLITPMLAAEADTSAIQILYTFGKAIIIIVLLFVVARFLVPPILSQVTKTKSRELFLISIVLICMTVAFITNKAGLSLALGAFLAGMVVSETGYGYQALGNVIPFKDVFTGFFFVSIGLLINLDVFIAEPIYIFGMAILIILIKGAVATVSMNLVGYPTKMSAKAGFSLAQVGEFSFILSSVGVTVGLLDDLALSKFIAISVLTMGATPFLIQYGDKIANLVNKFPIPSRIKNGYFYKGGKRLPSIKDHIVIVGYGLAGRNIAKVADKFDIKYIIIEMNPSTVREENAKGTPIIYGDASDEVVLAHARLKFARAIVISYADNSNTKHIVEVINRLYPSIPMIVRSRYLSTSSEFKALGAKEVIVDEIETTISLLSNVLNLYYLPSDDFEDIEKEIRNIDVKRKIKYRSKRDQADKSLGLAGVNVGSIFVPVASSLSDKSLRDIDARYRFSINIIAVRREGKLLVSPGSSFYIADRDELIITGKQANIAKFALEFENSKDIH